MCQYRFPCSSCAALQACTAAAAGAQLARTPRSRLFGSHKVANQHEQQVAGAHDAEASQRGLDTGARLGLLEGSRKMGTGWTTGASYERAQRQRARMRPLHSNPRGCACPQQRNCCVTVDSLTSGASLDTRKNQSYACSTHSNSTVGWVRLSSP